MSFKRTDANLEANCEYSQHHGGRGSIAGRESCHNVKWAPYGILSMKSFQQKASRCLLVRQWFL